MPCFYLFYSFYFFICVPFYFLYKVCPKIIDPPWNLIKNKYNLELDENVLAYEWISTVLLDKTVVIQ